MTVLTIRTCKRYAVRRPVQLAKAGHNSVEGLMIELSAEGCRISNLGRAGFTIGEAVTVEIGDKPLHGHIRWFHSGIAGVRLDQPLYTGELNSLISHERSQGSVQVSRYATSA